MNEAIQAKLQSTSKSSRALEILCLTPGLSKVSAAAFLIEMPELGTLKERQVVSLLGLAPTTRQTDGMENHSRWAYEPT